MAGFVSGTPSGVGDELMRALIRHAHESADVAQANTALGEFAGGLPGFLGGVVLSPRGLLPQRASGLKVARNRVGKFERAELVVERGSGAVWSRVPWRTSRRRTTVKSQQWLLRDHPDSDLCDFTGR